MPRLIYLKYSNTYRTGQRTRGATPLAAHRLEPNTCNAAVPAYDIVTGRSPTNPIAPRCSYPALVSYCPYWLLRGRLQADTQNDRHHYSTGHSAITSIIISTIAL